MKTFYLWFLIWSNAFISNFWRDKNTTRYYPFTQCTAEIRNYGTTLVVKNNTSTIDFSLGKISEINSHIESIFLWFPVWFATCLLSRSTIVYGRSLRWSIFYCKNIRDMSHRRQHIFIPQCFCFQNYFTGYLHVLLCFHIRLAQLVRFKSCLEILFNVSCCFWSILMISNSL